MYRQIESPRSGNKYNINSQEGRKILNNYLELLGGANKNVANGAALIANGLDVVEEQAEQLDNIDANQEGDKLMPKTFIVGYGSIINTKSRLSTGADNIGNAIPVRVKRNAGLQRVWNFQKPNVAHLTALGLQTTDGTHFVDKYGQNKDPRNPGDTFVISPDNTGNTINGVLYPVYENIEAFDEREEGYFRLRLRRDQIEALSWQNLPAGNDVEIYIYCLNPENQSQRATFQLPILQTYVDVVMNGCLEYGTKFAIEFIKSTEGWNKWWLNDRTTPRRPWLHQKGFKQIDRLLKTHVANVHSILPEDYEQCEPCKYNNMI